MKKIDEFIIKEKEQLTMFSWNNLINEDSKNNSLKIYDANIFKNSNILKIINDDGNEEDFEENEKKRKEEENKKENKEFLIKIEQLKSKMESDTNQIKLDMEKDNHKKEELKRLEEERIEKEKQDFIRKQREQIEREEKLKQERERKHRQDLRRQNDINAVGGTIKEKLKKAGNNFENIRKEVKKIYDNKNDDSKKIENKIFREIMAILPNITNLSNVDKLSKELLKILKELKDENLKEFYIYACFLILSKIKNILTSSALDYNDCYIKAKLIYAINSKTLTYMLFQFISNSCPFIIPVKDFESIFQDNSIIQEKYNNLLKDIKETNRKFTILEYFYFIYLYLDTNNNIKIIEDYLNNMEAFKPEEINYLIGNSFMCFFNVLGNYIQRNKKEWMIRINNIIKNIKIGLEIDRKNTKNKNIKSIIDKIIFDLENNYKLIERNQNTKFLQKMKI